MSVIVRLQNLPWAANAVDIRQFFHGLSIPEGGVHIVGGELGDAFIAFSTDEDARQAMLRDGGKVKDIPIKLYLSSRAEMQKIIDQARQQSLGMQQFMSMPTMTPISVPVTTITVPNMSVPSVSMPNVQNVQGMQVPLQNVAAMVTNMAKHDPAVITRPAPTATGIQEHPDNKSVISSNVSVKSDSEKDKKDKRRRRTRSHSRESSNSRTDSRSRSRSRSSSRSRDRKGRDRHYDRRRKRSRSRDRRRRRDRSRSRERSHRDRRKDYNRHGSREDFDDNNQSSRWNSPAQRNRPSKPRSDIYNRDQPNQNRNNVQQKPSISKGGSAEPMRPSFTNNNLNQSNINDAKVPLPIHHKDENSLPHPSLPVGSSSSGPALPTSSSLPPNSQNVPNSQNIGSISQNPVSMTQNPNTQNYFGDLPPPPMFNPQHMVSYPNYNPNGMPQFNMFPPMSPHQLNAANIQQDMSSKQDMDSKSDFGGERRNSPLVHSSGTEHKPNLLKKFETDLPQERGSKSRFGSETTANEIPLPSSDKIQGGGSNSGWGFKDSNYSYGNKETKLEPDKREVFSSGWGNVSNSNTNSINKSNTFNKKITNTCVQIKNVPDHTKHDDIRGFFRNNLVDSGCLKIVGDDQGRVNGVFVKFNSLGDKKKAICRSGCLLNNSIVTVLHADDKDFNSAIDVMDEQHHPYWIPSGEEMNQDDINLGSGMTIQKDIKKAFCCIKFKGDMRYHPFFNSKHNVHPHIRLLCDKFDPIDVCVVQSRSMNGLDALMKFENNSYAEAALQSLSNAKIDGKSIVVSTCSNEEFQDAKANCIAMDVQQFLRTARSQLSNYDKSNVKQDDRIDPRHQSSYSDRRSKLDNLDDDDSLDNDIDMKTSDDEPEPEFKRSNKVLLPTPSPMLQLPLLKDVSPSNCILMQNLPLPANDHEIISFFSDIGVVPTQIHIMLDSNNKQYGDAYCEFDKNEEAANATNKDGCSLGKNKVRVCLVSRQEMSNALGLFVSTSGPTNLGGPPQGGPFFNGPPGPPLFGNNMRMDGPRMGGNDWMPPPMFNPSGGSMGSNPNFNPNSQGDHGYRPGGRGGYRGRGDGDFSGRGRGDGDFSGRGRGDGDFSGRGRGDGDFGGRGSRGSRGGGGDRGGRGRVEFGGRGGRGGESIGRGGRGVDMAGRGGRGGDMGSRGGRGGDMGGRGGRGGDMGGRGGHGIENSNRGLGRGGSMRSNDNIGRGGGRGGMDPIGRGGRMNNDGGRGRGGRGNMRGGMSRGGRDDYGRNQPPDLMSLPSAPPIENQSGGPPMLLQSSKSVTRPIQLEEDSVREFGHTGCVVSAENVPYRAELNDILDFFSDFDLTAESIIRRYNDAGQVTGDARIAFKTPGEAKRAIKYLNKKMIGNRRVNLTLFK